ncbi:hypothetical protein WR25_25799 [Diploscapter pachys]|uniref:Neurotransmitter-gated ion-channel ligand-binding domain-containing protein n=1 Tax=Diploscapter pachys TaxID=2018661 RepID=A0A2A2JH57_9BILA|nr:hypothetical protein WR25_25799 [Diploscapter pachys]
MMDGYNKNIPPGNPGSLSTEFNSSSTDVNLMAGLYYVKIIELHWVDKRLKWNPLDYDGINHFFIYSSELWNPDVVTINTYDSKDFRTVNQKLASVFHNGTVITTELRSLHIACNFNLHKMPFDRQECKISLISYSMFIPLKLYFGYTMYTVSTYEKMVAFTISLKRNGIFYVIFIAIPSFVLNTLSIYGIFLPSVDRIGQLTVVLTNIMSLSFILGILSDSITKTSYLPLLDYFKLTQNILKDYNKNVPPFEVTNETQHNDLNLKVGLQYIKLIELSWNDQRISWNPDKYSGVKTVFCRSSELFIPDVIPVNSYDLADDRTDEQKLVEIDHTGLMKFGIIWVMSSVCSLNLRKMPFDTQMCNLSLVSYNIYFPMELYLENTIGTVATYEAMGNSEWKLDNITYSNEVFSELFPMV